MLEERGEPRIVVHRPYNRSVYRDRDFVFQIQGRSKRTLRCNISYNQKRRLSVRSKTKILVVLEARFQVFVH